MGKLIEKTLVGLIIFVLITFMVLLILTFFKPSCRGTGGTSVAIGERVVIINNVPYRITAYECVQKKE